MTTQVKLLTHFPTHSLLNRYQIRLEISMRCSDYIFDCVHLFYCKYKINTNGGGSSSLD